MKNSVIDRIVKKKIMTCVIGLGYVGLPLLQLLSKKKFNVIGLDIKHEQIIKAKTEGLQATLNPSEALKDADIIIICVPTPVDDDHRPDLCYVRTACQTIAKHIKNGVMVMLESTVAPGTTEEIVVSLLEESGLKAGKDFYVAYCPERIDPGNPNWTIENIPRVVAGISKESTDIAFSFYQNVLNGKIVKMSSPRAAEAVKIVENTFRDVNIAFVNELAKSFDKIDIDITEVIKGASTKPFGFLPHFPGCGVGGHCIAVDPYYLIEKAEKVGFSHKFLKLAREINDSMPDYTVEKLIYGLNQVGKSVRDSRITILGLSYKGGVNDTRESPAFEIIDKLKGLGASLKIFDPYVLDKSNVKTIDEAFKETDCIVIVTSHPEFRDISPQTLLDNRVKVVIDGRNILNKKKIQNIGLVYMGIGR